MHAVPKAPEKLKAKEGSRLANLKAQGRQPKLPDCSCRYLLDYLLEVGPIGAGGFGAAPLTHQEILAWQINMHRFLQPWEISMIRRLSVEFVTASAASEDEHFPAPWSGELNEVDRRAIASSLKASLERMG